MKILFVNQSDVDGGAARAAHRLASKLISMGFKLNMQVMRKIGSDAWVLGPENFILYIISRVFPHLDNLSKYIIGIKSKFPWTINIYSNPTVNTNFYNSFDIVHLHWIGKNTMTIRWMPNIEKPVVWTLHDSWAFTGGCHNPMGCRLFEMHCGNCPQLKTKGTNDFSKKIWIEKSKVYPAMLFHFIAPSRWMADEAAASSLLGGRPISVIPNGLDTNTFRPLDKSASRLALNLPLDKGIILFGAVSADSDRNKGMDLLLEALNFIIQNDKDFALRNIIVVFGTNNKSLDLIFPLPVVCLGVIKDEQLLPQIYSSADLTVVPSRRESFGQVASESSSCGTPVVAFETTGLIDIVVHLKTGYLAEPFSTVDLAEGIKMIVEDVGLRNFMSNMARERAITTFDIDITTQMHINLYSQIIDENHL